MATVLDTTSDVPLSSAASVARSYIESVGRHDLDPLDELLADGVVATFAGGSFGKKEWLQALGRLLPSLVRNDALEVFAAGARACVAYDFVTDTPAGAVRCVELVTVRDGRITEIELLLDRVAFAPVNEALRAAAAR